MPLLDLPSPWWSLRSEPPSGGGSCCRRISPHGGRGSFAAYQDALRATYPPSLPPEPDDGRVRDVTGLHDRDLIGVRRTVALRIDRIRVGPRVGDRRKNHAVSDDVRVVGWVRWRPCQVRLLQSLDLVTNG